MNYNKKLLVWGALGAGAAGLYLLGGVSDELSVSYQTLITEKLTGPVRIALVTDLHSVIHGGDQRPLIELIAAHRPDLILLGGDIVDDILPPRGSRLLLEGLRDTAPMYYVTGNHEFRSRRIGAIRAFLRRRGVVILSDEYRVVRAAGQQLLLAGVEDAHKRLYEDPLYSQRRSMERAFGGLTRQGLYKLLLAHRPEHIHLYRRYPFDLVLCGHAHGGQVRIPRLLENGLYASWQVFPRYTSGRYDLEGTTLVVSRGLAVYPLRPRVYNRPEVVIVTLAPPGAQAD